MSLHPLHLEDLRESGLSDETIEKAGIKSVPPDMIAKKLGFDIPKLQSVYEIPYNKDFSRFKAFYDPLANGKHPKYLQRKGSGCHLYLPMKEGLKDINIPLFITEGEKKTLKAIQEGLLCVGLSGLWNWSNGKGKLIADFDLIEFKNRQVCIVPDSDYLNPDKHGYKKNLDLAIKRLCHALIKKGAKVFIVELPHDTKGLDDYLIKHSLGEFKNLPVKEYDLFSQTGSNIYFINNDGYLCKYKPTKEGVIPYPLCNFDARIKSDITIDDGANHERYFEIIGKRGNKVLPTVRIKTNQFTSLSWVTDHWGNDAIIETVQTARDSIRHYIQTSSKDIDKRIIYSHTGWRVINGSWCYLTGNGAIGCEGVEVDLSLVGIKERYEIPLQPENETEAIKTSLALLDIADRKVTIPLLSLAYLSCITTILHPIPAFAGAFLHGITGSCKTSIASLFSSHYGDITINSLMNFETTANSIIKKLSVLKDTLVMIDDYRPTHSKAETEKQEAIAQKIIRLSANRTYRGRLNPDSSLKRENPINCMVLITGEDLPMLTSTLARVMLVELSRDMVNFEALTKSQRQRHLLPSAMASFIHWVIKNMDTIKTSFEQSFNDLRQQVLSPTIHGKLSEQFVYYVFTMTLICRWLQDKGIYSEEQAKELLIEGQEVLMGQIQKQSEMMQTEDPIEKFKEFLQTWLLLGKVRLSCKFGVNQDLGGVLGEFLGWYDDLYLYILSGATWDFLQRYCIQHGRHFPFSRHTFIRMLDKRKIIELDPDRLTKTIKIQGKTQRVWKVIKNVFIPD